MGKASGARERESETGDRGRLRLPEDRGDAGDDVGATSFLVTRANDGWTSAHGTFEECRPF